MSVDFKKLLSVDAGTVEKPKPIPVGIYDGFITGHKFDESKEKKTPYVRFTLRPNSPGQDVDPDAFAQFGGMETLNKKELSVDFYLTDDSLFRLRSLFEEVLGISVSGKTFDELIPQAMNQPVKVEVEHRPSADGQQVYAQAKRLLKA